MKFRVVPVLVLGVSIAAALGACSSNNEEDRRFESASPGSKTTDAVDVPAPGAVENVNAYVTLGGGKLTVLGVGEADVEDAVPLRPDAKHVAWELQSANGGAVIAHGTIDDPRDVESEFDENLAPAPIEATSDAAMAHVVVPNTGGTLVLKEEGAGGVELGRAQLAPLPQGTPFASAFLEPAVINDIVTLGRGIFRSVDNGSAWPRKVVDHGACGVINLLVLPDGYRSGELGTFQADAAALAGRLQLYAGYAQHWDKINIWAYSVASQDSGITDPGCSCPDNANSCTDCPAPAPKAKVNKNTAFGVSFGDNKGRPRRCIIPSGSQSFFTGARVAVARWYTRADYMVYLANTTEWAGCASGDTFTMSKAPGADFVLAHEAGHSVFALADEYEYGTCNAASAGNAPNTTKDVKNLKWKDITPSFVEGAQYCTPGNGVYRPEPHCLMREPSQPFCSVCRAQVDKTMNAKAAAANRNPKCGQDAGAPDASAKDATTSDASPDAGANADSGGPPPPCQGFKDDDYCGWEIGYPSKKARVVCRGGLNKGTIDCDNECYRQWGFAYCK